MQRAEDIAYQAVLSAPPFAIPTWVRPVTGASATVPQAMRLAGGLVYFDKVDVVQRNPAGHYHAARMDVDQLIACADDRNAATAIMDQLTTARADFAGLSMAEPQIMGILNVTPDSFSDGGKHAAPAQAIAMGKAMIEAGASVIDIGGESTRPGAEPVTRNQELARILPPITGLRDAGAVVSVDTRHAAVMSRATKAGAHVINDVGGLRAEGALDAAVAAKTPVIIMHMQGTPETMQADPQYGFAPVEIYEFLSERIAAALAAGIPKNAIAVDPGFGFGKTITHNMQVMNWTAMLHGLGVPLLIGASRKSSIAKLSRDEPADERVPGSLALAIKGVTEGAQLLRVHDVAETAQAVAVTKAMLATS